MEMTLPITLIVKAPNQQIEDQTVKCELSWTIHKLKGHLAEVYPSKPPRDEQKLIYSGQLLSDSVILKDVLRNYHDQDIHTVHLVCTPSPRSRIQEMPSKPKPEPPATVPTVSASSSDGLRPRTVDRPTQNSGTDLWSAWYQAQNSTGTNQYVQFAMLQQAYAQYMNQYLQMATNQLPQHPVTNESDQERVTPPVAAPAAQNQEANAQNQPEPADGVGALGDEPQMDRDWLDWFYVLSRILVLFCIVYFYSSPFRFTLVLLLGITLYMYQMGFFRAQAPDEAQARQPDNNNVVPRADAAANDGAAVAQAQPENVERRPTVLHTMWIFFTAFFSSLIPEIPNAV